MKTRTRLEIIAGCLLTLTIAVIVAIEISARNDTSRKAAEKGVPVASGLVVHEWGTFTSIAGKDGIALEWRPLNGPPDLPKFVHTIQKEGEGLRQGRVLSKGELTASVRMETPVLYFYFGQSRFSEGQDHGMVSAGALSRHQYRLGASESYAGRSSQFSGRVLAQPLLSCA